MNRVFDVNYARKLARGHDVKVKLRKNKRKGVSLYAGKAIKKGAVIAYYKFKVYDGRTHKQVKKGMYGMTVYTKRGNESKGRVGDIYPGSMAPPKNGITYWAYFSNEPSLRPKQDENAYLDLNLRANYKDRSIVKIGDTMTYRLKAARNIKKGEEIAWCYGGVYNRDYEANCSE